MEARLHTDPHYEAELKELHLKILEMGGFVEKQIAAAVTALVERDDELARGTIERDHTANRMDVEIDELCLRLLALHQPAAKDLRLITTGLKITTDGAVEDTTGRVIPGLFAGGELVGGIFYQNYLGGAGLMSGSVFGRIAGRSAGQYTKA